MRRCLYNCMLLLVALIVAFVLAACASGGARTAPALPATFPPPSATPMIPAATASLTPIPTDAHAQTAWQTPSPTGYAVAFVAEGDVLNVRSGPGVDSPEVAQLPPDYGRDAGPLVFITGEGVTVDGSLWVPVQGRAFDGWVNRWYLTEAVSPSTFCEGAMGQTVLDGLLSAVENRDGEALAALVRPDRGLLLRLNAWNREVQLSADEVRTFFEDTTSRDFGVTYGGNEQVIGSTSELIVPLLARDLLDPNREIDCNQTEVGPVNTSVYIPMEYGALNYYTVMRPPPDLEMNAFDWGIWAVGVEFWEGQPYLAYLVHYVWEP